MRYLILSLCAALCAVFLVALPAEALAYPVADLVDTVEADVGSALGELVSAAKSGNWRYVLALSLSLLLVVFAKLRDKVKWFRGDRGGAIAVMVLSIGGALATALASDASIDFKLFLGAAGIAWTAVGGYTWVKRLIWPKDKAEVDEQG
jgi:hypothetical protein